MSIHTGSAALADEPASIYQFSAMMKGEEVSLEKYRGQVLVVVNVASE
ncbi:glutathione peroxidase [Haematococcus lacustris]|uniref:Glutathione peroxidase n=1 Tax=Haematococcus lacustris TaxID=44745 RepID=A0A699Z092_HAELA|nr:glutathione peroxidase [Haematococcus lacustris]